jgi:hypothetical protein
MDCIDMRRLLDLPPELKCHILQYLLADDELDSYTLLEHQKVAELLRCNFVHQFRLVQLHRPLASQLQQILLPTARLSAAPPCSSRRLGLSLHADSVDIFHTERFESAAHAVCVLSTYRTRLADANTILTQFAKMTRGNTAI